MEFLQGFTFSAKYKAGKTNIVGDALSRKHMLLSVLDSKILDFEILKEYYAEDVDFKKLYRECENGVIRQYNIQY